MVPPSPVIETLFFTTLSLGRLPPAYPWRIHTAGAEPGAVCRSHVPWRHHQRRRLPAERPNEPTPGVPQSETAVHAEVGEAPGGHWRLGLENSQGPGARVCMFSVFWVYS